MPDDFRIPQPEPSIREEGWEVHPFAAFIIVVSIIFFASIGSTLYLAYTKQQQVETYKCVTVCCDEVKEDCHYAFPR